MNGKLIFSSKVKEVVKSNRSFVKGRIRIQEKIRDELEFDWNKVVLDGEVGTGSLVF